MSNEMAQIHLLLSALVLAVGVTDAHACAQFDLACKMREHQLESERAVEKAHEDLRKAIEKAAHDAGIAAENSVPKDDKPGPLVPVREYLKAEDIPPVDAGAYGLVVFRAKATAANRRKLAMVCNSFKEYFPPNETHPTSIPATDRMITVWPLDSPTSAEALADNCDFAIDHYDLFASQMAITDAERQNAKFDGSGPYLIGWSPSNSRGIPDKLVLVVDMSADNTQASIDHQFLFWKSKIVQDPSLWRNGFSIEGVRVAIHDFADRYGQGIANAIKLVSAK
jgi:hypothetical protein